MTAMENKIGKQLAQKLKEINDIFETQAAKFDVEEIAYFFSELERLLKICNKNFVKPVIIIKEDKVEIPEKYKKMFEDLEE